MATKAPPRGGTKPPKIKVKNPKDTVARNDLWTLRLRHERKHSFLGLFDYRTKPKLFVRPRLTLLLSSKFEAKTVKLDPTRIVSIGWIEYGGPGHPGLLRLRIDHPKKRRGFWQKVLDQHPDLIEYDFTFGFWSFLQFGKFKAAGVKQYGWRVKK